MRSYITYGIFALLLMTLGACNGSQSQAPAAPQSTRPATGQPTSPQAEAVIPSAPTPSGAEAANLVMPQDFTYQGAFRLPGGEDPPQTFAYGGNAMTFNPANGTLFVMGHDRMAYGDLPNGNQVAEISIPTPVNTRNIQDLPYAEFRQNFHDVLAGYFNDLEEIPRVGMAYVDYPATGPKIHLGWGQHMPPDDAEPTHGWFSPNLSNPDFQGVWFIGEQSFDSVNGYVFEIPAAWADAHAGGRYLATGRYRDGGWSGMGPALFAYRPWLDDGIPPPSGTHLKELTLLLYQSSRDTEGIEKAMHNYQHPDEWEGGAWLSTSSSKSAVLFAGTKGTGEKYWYGWVNPAGPTQPCVEHALVNEFTVCRMADGAPCPPEDLKGCQGHNDYRGWWSARFDAWFILYNPADLARVAAGELEPWAPQPYASLDIDEYLYLNPPEWELDMLGRGDQRRMRVGPVAYDRTNDMLYVLELYADGAKPVVHVWKVQ